MPVCNKCSVNITKAPSIKWFDCDLTWHAKCQQLTKEDIDYLKEANNIWRCSKCASAKRASLRLENPTNLESNELLEIKEIILHLRDCFQNHKDDTAKNFEILNTKFNAIDKIITENQALKTHISQLEKQIESIERHQIANDIIIDGLNVNINDSMINDCHRVGFNHSNTRPRRILVSFSNHQVKADFLKARQIFRNFSSKFIDIQPDVPIYIRENLTTKGNKLFKEARDLKKQLNFQFVWTKNAIILLRKNETDKIIRVDSEDTIQNIKGQYEDLNS
ncbi:uncharacterized protein LOC103308612 [Acyrthosiphon pisum]|uniref:FP protein C-terminal domain-containing protein n=1 Tax=Acyrthosiphon pisum TaxID=7029 RepID=A0A8R1X1T4_ACYPI|nr:uncharacterized protein LOC103308612 [Acyrthosiphon pisum]|eukprot:XP_008180524.1 PREDICTED: uncharacterized protein LOC103308612 [Acyrthosiphon pisum]